MYPGGPRVAQQRAAASAVRSLRPAMGAPKPGNGRPTNHVFAIAPATMGTASSIDCQRTARVTDTTGKEATPIHVERLYRTTDQAAVI